MLHEKPFGCGPLGDDVDGTSMASKRRRKCIPQSSSSDAPTATAQGHHQGPITDMDIVQAQDNTPKSAEDDEEIKELFGPEVILSKEDQDSFVKLLPPDIPPPRNSMKKMSFMDYYALLERHGRFRIAYYKALPQESKDLDGYYEHREADSRIELKDLDAYSEDEIRHKYYFKHLEKDECFEWFFHPDDEWNPDLDDYQRIVLKSFLPGRMEPQYPDVDGYHERYHTYEMDAVYIKYYGELSKRIKWIEAFLHLDEKSAEWKERRTRGWRQALRIATRLPNMTLGLAYLAYPEYISELREDASLKDLDVVFFLIWRLVVKDNRRYMDAVTEVYNMDTFHIHKRAMEVELNKAPAFLTMRDKILYITRRFDISANTEDDEAQVLFREGIAHHFKKKYMVNYAEKKLEIAKLLNWHKSIDVPGRTEAPEEIEML